MRLATPIGLVLSGASVTKELFHMKTGTGYIGRFGFDRAGDPTVGTMMVFRYTDKDLVPAPTVTVPRILAKG